MVPAERSHEEKVMNKIEWIRAETDSDNDRMNSTYSFFIKPQNSDVDKKKRAQTAY